MIANDFFVAMGIVFILSIGVGVCAGVGWLIMYVLELKKELERYNRELCQQDTRLLRIEMKLKEGEKNQE